MRFSSPLWQPKWLAGEGRLDGAGKKQKISVYFFSFWLKVSFWPLFSPNSFTKMKKLTLFYGVEPKNNQTKKKQKLEANHTIIRHLIVGFSSPYPWTLFPPNSNRHAPRRGGERILKTNKQRIDLLRRITEVLITSDPSPPLSKSAPLVSLIFYPINASTFIGPRRF